MNETIGIITITIAMFSMLFAGGSFLLNLLRYTKSENKNNVNQQNSSENGQRPTQSPSEASE
ncbi:hypothetical protein COK39_24675 [Priestia megaterium]|nr:hypothetical protein COK39_24675 [Priestia megaterium]